MPKIIASVNDATKLVNINGLDYPKGLYTVYYVDADILPTGNVDYTKVKVGIKCVDNKTDMNISPCKVSDYLKSDNSPYSTLDSLITDLAVLLGFNRAGSSPSSIPPVSATVSGIVDNTPLQELGGVDKIINKVRAGQGNTVDMESTAFGEESLSVDKGGYNTAFGWHTLSRNTDGYANDAFGDGTLAENILGQYNSAFGGGALQKTTGGFGNVAVGSYSMHNLQGVGFSQSIIGCRNTAVGVSSMQDAQTAGGNVAIGDTALKSITTGNYNIVLGQQAGSAITTGSDNVVIANTGHTGVSGLTTGSNNLIISPNKGNVTGITTGSGNVVIGKVTGLPAAATNTITIADGAGNKRMEVSATGIFKIVSGVPVYVDNTAAIAGGLTAGCLYRTATGILMIVF